MSVISPSYPSLVRLFTLILLLLASASLLAHSYPTRPGLSAELYLAASWRSDNQLSDQAILDETIWQIPGVLMGGHSDPYEKHTRLDEFSLLLHYLTDDRSYASIKLGSHGGTEISLENALIGQGLELFGQSARVEAGLMTAFFSPSNHDHPSTSLFSLPGLGYSVLMGTHIQDTGVRAAIGQEERGFSIGLEGYQGSSYPAGGNAGLYAAYLRHAHQGFYLEWQLQAWHLTAEASHRKDDRSAGGHSHGTTTGKGFSGTFNGDTQASGLFTELKWNLGHQQAIRLRSEYMQVDVDGLVQDESRNRQLLLDGDYQSLSLEPSLLLGDHTFGLRYERLSIQNTLTGPAANTLGTEANLISDGHNPQRLSLAWHWQVSPSLALRAEWMKDQSSINHQPEIVTLGVIWKQTIL